MRCDRAAKTTSFGRCFAISVRKQARWLLCRADSFVGSYYCLFGKSEKTRLASSFRCTRYLKMRQSETGKSFLSLLISLKGMKKGRARARQRKLIKPMVGGPFLLILRC